MMEKEKIRRSVLQLLRSWNQEEYKSKSKQIVDRLLGTQEFKESLTIGITISRFPEVDTFPLIETAWSLGKRIAVPRCIPAERGMDFRTIDTFQQLENSYIDLLEPIVSETEPVKKNEIDLLIVPGVVFSATGSRIGFGGGYYDRYLTDYKGLAWSLAFETQIIERIPHEPHDLPVSKIITESRILSCSAEGK